MKRIVLMVTVALVMALMLAVAGPALATVHPLSNSECSGLDETTTVAGSQNPPGISPEDEDAVGSDPDLGPTAQPVISVLTAQGTDSPAFKQEPVPGSESFCPVEK
jgi:hypothetical protein